MPMPPQGAPAAPQAPQDPQAQPQAGGDSPAAQMVGQVHDGLMGILELAKQAHLSPDTIKLGTDCYNAFQAFVDHLGQAEGQGSPAPQAPGAPIQDGAAPDSTPYQFQH